MFEGQINTKLQPEKRKVRNNLEGTGVDSRRPIVKIDVGLNKLT